MTPSVTRSIGVTADGPPSQDLSAVETLVHPLSPAEFLERYWHREPVHLHGWRDRFRGVFGQEALARVLTRQHDLGLSVRVSGDHEGDDGGAAAHVLVDGADLAGVEQRLRAGTSLCVDPVDRADATVAALADELRAGLGHPGAVSVKCYLSTPGFGFNTHFDAQVVTTVQIEGTKRWRVSPTPGVPFPLDNAFLDGTGTIRYNGRRPGSLAAWERPEVDRDGFVEVVLHPGDVLCLPAGTWHEAKATGGHSLALNFSFAPVDVGALLVDLVGASLDADETWRSGLSRGDPATEVGRRAEDLATALHLLAQDPAAIRQRLADRVTDGGADHGAEYGRRAGGAHPAAAGHAAAVAASAAHAGRRLQCVLAVSDASRAASWYGRVLGSRVVSTIDEFGWVEVTTSSPGVTLGLTEVPTGVSNRGAVLDFEVADLEQVRQALTANGATVEAGSTEIAGVARVLSALDPDGNRLMFFEPHEQGSSK